MLWARTHHVVFEFKSLYNWGMVQCVSSKEIGAATMIFPPTQRVTYCMKMMVICTGLHRHQEEYECYLRTQFKCANKLLRWNWVNIIIVFYQVVS